MIIYRITNRLNGKCYIGQTTRNIKARIAEHKSKKSLIGKAILKFGEENFIIEQLENCSSLAHLNAREAYWIQKLDTIQPNGYNKAIGASKYGENNGFYGKNHSPETIESNKENQPTRKAVRCIETGEVFVSVRDCARRTGFSRSKILNSCKRKKRNENSLNFEFFNEKRGEIAC